MSDREIERGKLPIPMLMAVGAVHHRLVSEELRTDCNIVAETATARDPHHFACLIGYGASVVYPYLAYATLAELARAGVIRGKNVQALMSSYRKGINKGLYKIISKMGISTLSSYRGAQLFEAVGLADEVVMACFTGTVSRIGGATFADLEAEQQRLARDAWIPRRDIRQGGVAQVRRRRGSTTPTTPTSSAPCTARCVRGDYDDYAVFANLVNARPVAMFRDLFKVKLAETPLDLVEVEAEAELFKRFDSAGMSLGALSPEAHESLAIAMNRLGGRSNSGEGGEDPARYGTERGLAHQAGGVRALRRHAALPGQRRRAADQRSPRGPSPARGASCPATRSTSRSPGFATPGPAWP